MGCEQYKATDYSAKARACREKENEGNLSKDDQLKLLKKRFTEREKEYNIFKEDLEFDDDGNVIIENRFAQINAKNVQQLGQGLNVLNKSIFELEKSMEPPTVEEWKTETDMLIAENPDADTETVAAIMNRAGGPTAEQIKFDKKK